MIEAVWTSGPPPWELLRAMLCRHLNRLPSEVDELPADEILQMWRILNLFDQYAAKKKVR